MTEATTGLLYQSRMMNDMCVEQSVEWLAGEIEVIGENLPQCNFVNHNSHMTEPDSNPGCSGGKPVTNRPSYGCIAIYTFLWLFYAFFFTILRR
jgi:hypothetical protein